ncbi:hypothetical protein E2C01_079548 [Portunus trituberculatus]|uniref:Uncharacterized protein n=1 Tax=Portunus trituberculatus TaxID=210409 RepID=A0A5B7IVX4_PORTR|nr:hypothetical protein [Portunus trituberculatus]
MEPPINTPSRTLLTPVSRVLRDASTSAWVLAGKGRGTPSHSPESVSPPPVRYVTVHPSGRSHQPRLSYFREG